MLHGTQGTYIKEFCDTQEEQLISGMTLNDKGFGEEPPEKEGRLTTIDSDGKKHVELVPSFKGDYSVLFEGVYQAVRNNVAFPVTEHQVIEQIKLLQA